MMIEFMVLKKVLKMKKIDTKLINLTFIPPSNNLYDEIFNVYELPK